MSKKKFVLSSDLVKVSPEKTETLQNRAMDIQKSKATSNFTGPNTNRVKFGTSIDADLKAKFKIWVANQGSDISTEVERAIKLLIK